MWASQLGPENKKNKHDENPIDRVPRVASGCREKLLLDGIYKVHSLAQATVTDPTVAISLPNEVAIVRDIIEGSGAHMDGLRALSDHSVGIVARTHEWDTHAHDMDAYSQSLVRKEQARARANKSRDNKMAALCNVGMTDTDIRECDATDRRERRARAQQAAATAVSTA